MTNKDFYGIVEDRRLGGEPKYFLGYPDDWNMNVPPEVLKCVVFISVEVEEEGHKKDVPVGTAFFVGFPAKYQGAHMYLVTAKHLVEEASKFSMSLRMNACDGQAKKIGIDGKKWFSHPEDENVDIAVIPFGYDEKQFDLKAFPTNRFLTKEHVEEGEIKIGDEVFVTGLFANHYGKSKNLPIVRVGNVAMVSDEKEKVYVGGWHGGCEIEAHLIEGRSTGGISGSPVFFSKPLVNQTKDKTFTITPSPGYYLGGVIHGHFDDVLDTGDIKPVTTREERINMGIAIVTPASKLSEVLEQEELKELRSKVEENFLKKSSSTTLD